MSGYMNWDYIARTRNLRPDHIEAALRAGKMIIRPGVDSSEFVFTRVPMQGETLKAWKAYQAPGFTPPTFTPPLPPPGYEYVQAGSRFGRFLGPVLAFFSNPWVIAGVVVIVVGGVASTTSTGRRSQPRHTRAPDLGVLTRPGRGSRVVRVQSHQESA